MKNFLIYLIVGLLASGIVIATPTEANAAVESNPQAEYDTELNPLWDDKEGFVRVGRGINIQVIVANTGDQNINFNNATFRFKLEGPLDREDSYRSDAHDIFLPAGETMVVYFPVVDTFEDDDIGEWTIYTAFWEYSQERRNFDKIDLEVLTETGYEEEIGREGKPWYDSLKPVIPSLIALAIAIAGSLIAGYLWHLRRRKKD